MGWKFWTWPGQIRALKLALQVANAEIKRLMVSPPAKSAGEHQRHLRGQHRNHL